MAMVGWRLLRSGSGPGAVLSIDFTLAKVRAQANFGDLAPALPDDYAVWGTDESAWPVSSGALGAQLDDWLHRGLHVDRPVRAVFGFCASASLAGALARRLADAGGTAPAVILFDPVTTDVRALLDQAEESVRHLDPTTVATGTAGGDGVDARPETDLGDLVTALAGRYAATAAAVGEARSIPSSIVAQLSRRVETHLRFLALCATAWSYDPAPPQGCVLSRDHQLPPALAGVPEVRLDVARDELLAHPDTARTAARLLAGALAERRS